MYQRLTNGNVVIQLPQWLVRDALAGRANAVSEYGLSDKDLAFQVLAGEWEIVGVETIEGNLERGTPGGVALEFAPSNSVFHRRKRTEKGAP